jgi:hypothetical protein
MKRFAATAAAFVVGGLVALLLYLNPVLQKAKPVSVTPRHPVWTEIKWPFLMDQWGMGKAYQCKAADCGVEMTLYIRPKIGFCSATIGVADDNELARLSDFEFMNGASAAHGNGHVINVGWMKGRIRAYGPDPARATAFSIAYNNDSDALVATLVFNDAQPDDVEPAVVGFLDSEPMRRWVKSALGL